MIKLNNIAIVELQKGTLIQGTLLLDNQDSEKEGFGFKRILASYGKRPLILEEIFLTFNGKRIKIKTNKQGNFSVLTRQKIKGKLTVLSSRTMEEISVTQTYPIRFEEQKYPLSVISDLDDTVLVSHTRSMMKRIGTLLFIPPLKRVAIGFTQKLLQGIANEGGNVFYVSKSEANLFHLLSHILMKNHLPPGPLFLTSYLRLFQLLHAKKGVDFKTNTIKAILDNSPQKKYILIGDDTQNDIIVYRRIAEEYLGRIHKIFIRKTVKGKMRIHQSDIDSMNELDVPFLYFDDQQDWKSELKEITDKYH